MACVIMVQGTMSGVGKSVITAALCRIFAQDGYRTAPFKSQNMALNSYITDEGLEMGRAQVMQAECAGVAPKACMNPILLKPVSDQGSQVIVMGEVIGNMRAIEYFAYKKGLLPVIRKAYDELAALADIIVVEGAGSPAELNLKENDIVNMGLAALLDAPVLLVGDIDRGGIFAQLIGTVSLLEESEKKRVRGLIVNRFRGDGKLFESGVRILEEKSGVPVLGTIPYMHLHLDDEDSLSERLREKHKKAFTIVVIRLPHISNFTDFNTFDQAEDVAVCYADSPRLLDTADMIVLPGTKNTIGDLRWLKAQGLDRAICNAAAAGKLIIGICGGYQMLGRRISDPYATEDGGEESGLALLPVDTVMTEQKKRVRFTGHVECHKGLLGGLRGCPVEGYEIHMGETVCFEEVEAFTSDGTGVGRDNVYGSYIHGLFDRREIASGILRAAAPKDSEIHGAEKMTDYAVFKEKQYDALADTVRANLDMNRIYGILGVKHDG